MQKSIRYELEKKGEGLYSFIHLRVRLPTAVLKKRSHFFGYIVINSLFGQADVHSRGS